MQQKIIEYYNSNASDIIRLKKNSRIDKKEQSLCIEHIPKRENLKIIEVGFGVGTLIRELISVLPESASIVGIEISETMYEIAKGQIPGANLYLGDILELPNEIKDSYDVIICLGVIEHYKEINAFFDSFDGIIKKGGTLILSFAESSLLGKITAYRCRRRGVPAYTHKKKKIQNTLKSQGFSVVDDISLGLSQRMMIFEKH